MARTVPPNQEPETAPAPYSASSPSTPRKPERDYRVEIRDLTPPAPERPTRRFYEF